MQFVDRCNLKLSKVADPFPVFEVPEGETPLLLLRDGLPRRSEEALRDLDRTSP